MNKGVWLVGKWDKKMAIKVFDKDGMFSQKIISYLLVVHFFLE